MLVNTRHICVYTNNLKLALKFYVDILGLEIVTIKYEEGEYIETLLGIKDIKLIYAKLASKKDKVPSLELYYVLSERHMSKIKGHHHISFTIENIDKLRTMLIINGVIPLSSPQLDPEGKNKVMFCRDYDGNLVELVEEIGQKNELY